jgi:hypothetical protein
MGSANSQSENPSLFQYTFTKVHGQPSVHGIQDKLQWNITRISLYQIPVDMIAHLARTSHYFLLFDVEFEGLSGNILCHFTEDGVKHLDFYSSRSQAIFAPFEGSYLTNKVEMLRYQDVTGRKVEELVKAFEDWNKPFNLILSNCRNFTKFIERRFVVEVQDD